MQEKENERAPRQKYAPLTQLDLTDPAQQAAYEHTFYLAFSATDNKLTRKIWKWDDERQRIRTQVSYATQRVYGQLNRDGIVEIGLAINIERQKMQLHEFGFAPPRDGQRIAEVLTAFSHPRFRRHFLWVDKYVIRPTYARLYELGYQLLYGTCANDRLLTFYQRVGWQHLQTRRIEDAVRHFLVLDLRALTEAA